MTPPAAKGALLKNRPLGTPVKLLSILDGISNSDYR
jgi:hypothetical protein